MNGKSLKKNQKNSKKVKEDIDEVFDKNVNNLMTVLKVKFHYKRETPHKDKLRKFYNLSPMAKETQRVLINREKFRENEYFIKINEPVNNRDEIKSESPNKFTRQNHRLLNKIDYSKFIRENMSSLNNSNEKKGLDSLSIHHSSAFLLDKNKNKNRRSSVISFPTNIPLNVIQEFQPFFNYFQKIRKNHNLIQREMTITKNLNPNAKYSFIINCTSDIKNILPIMTHRINWKESQNKDDFNFCWRYYTKKFDFKALTYNENIVNNNVKSVNLFEKHISISDKKIMFLNLMNYCNQMKLNVFDYIPFTIIMLTNRESFDFNYKSFVQLFDFLQELTKDKIQDKVIMNKKYTDLFLCYPIMQKKENCENIIINFTETFLSEKNYWVMKPTDLYQGKCIKISNQKDKILTKLKKFFKGIHKTFVDSDDENKKEIITEKVREESPEYIKKNKKMNNNRHLSTSVILQKYLDKPLLYLNRKFDIRIWTLVDHLDNVFVFREGHLKASSEEYDLNKMDPFIHLTNYSVQKNSHNFSKFEYGNEISFKDFQDFLDLSGLKLNFYNETWPTIKDIIELTMNSVKGKLNRSNSQFCFQIFGYDFILDRNFKPWLLEINDNPGLSESSPLIKTLVPRMIDDAFRLTIDKIYNTIYDDSVYNKETKEYTSKFPVEGYSISENIFEFICNIST